jgi:hypothetical protein
MSSLSVSWKRIYNTATTKVLVTYSKYYTYSLLFTAALLQLTLLHSLRYRTELSTYVSLRLSLSLMLWPTVSCAVCLGIKHPFGAYGQIILFRQLRVCLCRALSLTRERVCVYNCCWLSPAQSFSGPSPVELVTVFYSLRFETSLFVAS